MVNAQGARFPCRALERTLEALYQVEIMPPTKVGDDRVTSTGSLPSYSVTNGHRDERDYGTDCPSPASSDHPGCPGR